MPRSSRDYCLHTPESKMGFSQRSSCKAQGLMKRTSRSQKGQYIISPKYKSKTSRKQRSINKRSNSNKIYKKSSIRKSSIRKSSIRKSSIRKSKTRR